MKQPGASRGERIGFCCIPKGWLKMQVIITDNISERAAALLRTKGFAVENVATLPRDELVAKASACDAIAVRSATRLDADLLGRLPQLKLVVRGGVGVDNIDIAAATRLGIAVANTPGANSVATAELTLALMLALARHTIEAHNSLLRGEWNRSAYRGVELYGKMLGILGFGRVGREVARRARAFGMRVITHDPYVPEQVLASEEVKAAALDEVFAGADYLTLHLPLNAETHQIIDAAAIAKMKPGVRLVNAARGGLLDEPAVAAGLAAGHIGGVALDVYTQEPPGAGHVLIGTPGVIHMPHLGAYTHEAQAKVADEVAGVIADFFLQQKHENVLNEPDLAA